MNVTIHHLVLPNEWYFIIKQKRVMLFLPIPWCAYTKDIIQFKMVKLGNQVFTRLRREKVLRVCFVI